MNGDVMADLNLPIQDSDIYEVSVWHEGCDVVELRIYDGGVTSQLACLTSTEARRIAIALLDAADDVEARTA